MKQDDDLPGTFGEAVRARRTDLGLSQRALAQRMSEMGVQMDATAVTRMETNQREPRFTEGIALARFLGFDPFLYAPKGFSYAGLEAKVVADFLLAADAIAALAMSSVEAIGMHNTLMMVEGGQRLDRPEIAPSIVAMVGEAISVEDRERLAALGPILQDSRAYERDGALLIVREALRYLGITVENMEVADGDPAS
ncbi:helix-turn-helix domain-containing protein [Gordonia alkanivorans]|uniref:helix-turn-helix domain-containing protein n=1 Tax=Gordonia alkanivorans TaxID=84096 RepID=UPI002447ABCF|nr:helix-turn-helix transcriptional regulator [Gordonia alkanivorans]MDH3007084.1 helix-turn-helix transcriptional regulator [Gordonia alkanivorans]MDH3015042.1 helix-turn-helix transcriptional regulator [Gordonia alkanivorans]MDH3021629.1 helix-turn-helix transcriptional regulator [Gordonia alkanivorans]MDH3040148.1 helix-turn-helix transcriptional regulator [Gordonia alkanivorans]MDH3059406.1 helix-turn-helix transcriptional regulator [Gordonia alkanivorans]